MFVIIREIKHPANGKRYFKALPMILEDEIEASVLAQATAKEFKSRAWAVEFPSPPAFELILPADFEKGGKHA